MANEHIVETLKRHYPQLQRVSESVFRGLDLYEGSPYAIRYFDIGTDPISVAANLSEYQDKLLGADYFNTDKSDLRWNHYLYFVAGTTPSSEAFQKAKTLIESDREYARKFVINDRELDDILTDPLFGGLAIALPPDPLSIWTGVLDRHQLGFIVDERLQVPTIVRHIADGEAHALLRAPAAPQIGDAERAVSDDFLATLTISHFRKYPVKRTFSFGSVNLILGVNGVGKTSLLEAVEYVFCGKTRRGGSLDLNSSVSSVLARSNLTLETAATTAPAALRARHLAWYGKSELRKLTLDDSFSKFNFLDTDAAVRLTVERSRERISEDLTLLLLGAEAAKVLDRFDRVVKQLQDSRKALENDINIREHRRIQSAERLQQLQERPRESDQLFVDLLQYLDSVGWKRRPAAKDDVNGVSTSLQTAIVNVGVLKSHSGEINSIDSEVASLTDMERTVARLADTDADHRAERARANAKLNELTRRMEAMDALLPIVAAGLVDTHQRRESLEKEIGETEAMLSEAEAAVTDLPSDRTLRQLPLSKAARDWTEQIERIDKTIDEARKALAALERTQSILVSLHQRLRSSAREIIQHTHDGTHCPLCGAEYAEDELQKRLNDATRGLVRDESEYVRAQLQTDEANRQKLVAQLRALQVLQQYTKTDKAKTPVETAVKAVSAGRERLAKLQAELDTTRNTLQTPVCRQVLENIMAKRVQHLAAKARVVVASALGPKKLSPARKCRHALRNQTVSSRVSNSSANR